MEKVIGKLLNSKVQQFIKENAGVDPSVLALKYKEVEGVPIAQVINQIRGKQKAKIKLPSWYSSEGIVFPPTLNLEQSSSEVTSIYKSNLITGTTCIDLTGGFGIDTTAFARKFDKVIYVERDQDLSDIVAQNLRALNITNVEIKNDDAGSFIELVDRIDAIYIDPARRDQNNKKVFRLQDCEPDVVKLLPELLKKTSQLLLKTSPLLDIKASLKELGHIAQIHVVAVDNECKEVLYIIKEGKPEHDIEVIAINILKEQQQLFKFTFEEEKRPAPISPPLNYLLEPNASILKAGAFNTIACKFGLGKLHPNSHLYTSEKVVDQFPGRQFRIVTSVKYDKKAVIEIISNKQANITARNFPDSVEQIRKKLDLKDGGDYYLFATTDSNGKPVVIITKKEQ